MSNITGRVTKVDVKGDWLVKFELTTDDNTRTWLGAYTSKKGYNTAGFAEAVRNEGDNGTTRWEIEYETVTEKGYTNLYVREAKAVGASASSEVQPAAARTVPADAARPVNLPMHHMTAANCATEILKTLLNSDDEVSCRAVTDMFDEVKGGILASMEDRYAVWAKASEDSGNKEDGVVFESDMDQLFKEDV